MAIGKYRYKINDKIRSKYGEEFEIIGVASSVSYMSDGGPNEHFRLKSLLPGRKDPPEWLPGHVVYERFEPCNPTIKLLFDNNRRSEGTETLKDASSADNKKRGVGGD